MKILIIIIFSFGLSLQGLLGQTKAEILKFKIAKVDAEIKTGNYKMLSSSYYNKYGNEVMSIMSSPNYKYISYNEYQDSLLVKQIGVDYNDEKLSDSQVVKFLYKLDNNGMIIENKMILSDGKVKINKIHYDKDFNIDTLLTDMN
ncbi:MAG: hypothetical protein ABI402_12445 [Ferruginibacter sp.]